MHWLFSDLGEEELASLSALAVHRTVPAGTMLFAKGDPTPGLHLVERGAIKIFTVTADGAERIIDIIGPGELCGEMGVVDGAPSAAWGQTLGQTRVAIIPAAAFERLLLTEPSVGLKLCRVLAAKLRATAGQLDEAIFLGARERVLRHLVRLAERHGRAAETGVRLSLKLTHQEIARLAGTARETVSRVLGELQDGQILRFDERRMVIMDLPALRRLAGMEG
ncbi:MAG TPA: Crp/Fnr family transcriptional regulator [Symbiobacteriaceae bacterium]|nr:Crp/Fnr family transcriptional regulator [Symbiobacteriaceae bacterium]